MKLTKLSLVLAAIISTQALADRPEEHQIFAYKDDLNSLEQRVDVIENTDYTGPKGDKGDKGDAGRDGVSIKGDKGDRGEQGLQGVAGRDGKDADMSRVESLENKYKDYKYSLSSMEYKIKHLEKDMHSAVASSMAVGSLLQAPKGMSMVSVGVGSYAGQEAVAVGVAYTSENYVYLKASMTYNSDEFGGSAAIGKAF